MVSLNLGPFKLGIAGTGPHTCRGHVPASDTLDWIPAEKPDVISW